MFLQTFTNFIIKDALDKNIKFSNVKRLYFLNYITILMGAISNFYTKFEVVALMSPETSTQKYNNIII